MSAGGDDLVINREIDRCQKNVGEISLSEEEHTEPTKFPNRPTGGKALGKLLYRYSAEGFVLVLAISKGGVPIAYEIAESLAKPFDVLIARKIDVSWHDAWQQPQSIGAVAREEARVLNTAIIDELRLSHHDVDQAIKLARAEQAGQEAMYRGTCRFPDVRGYTVILADDGIETGTKMQVAIEVLRKHQPARIVAVAPVGSESACRKLGQIADDVVCPLRHATAVPVRSQYDEPLKMTDEEVHALIEGSRHDQSLAHVPSCATNVKA